MDGREQNGNQGQGSFGMSSGPSFGSFTFDESKVKVPEPEPMPTPQPVTQPEPQPVIQPAAPEMSQPQPEQPQMPMGQPQPMGQPVPMGQPMPANQPMLGDNYQVTNKKNSRGLVIGIAIGVFVILAIAVTAIIMFGQPPALEPEPEPEPEPIDYEADVPTLVAARRYCATSGLYVWDLPKEKSEREAVYGTVNCRYNEQVVEIEDDAEKEVSVEEDTDDEVARIEEYLSFNEIVEEPTNTVIALDYFILTKNHNELESVKMLMGDYSSFGSELENTTDYKIFYQFNNSFDYTVVSYTVFYKNSLFLMVAKNAEEIETALTVMGFPKSEHEVPTEESEAAKREKEREQSKATPAKRDVLRRNDMIRVGTSLMHYMTNNKGELPSPSVWTATTDYVGTNACKAENTACNFVMSYLNTTDDRNDFEDPSGNVYNVLITGNIADGGEIGNITYSTDSKLVLQSKKYTIAGRNPFYEHVVYIIPGAKCDGAGARAAKKDNYAVLYRLEEGRTYCLNN